MNLDDGVPSSQSNRCRVLRSSPVEVIAQVVTFHLLFLQAVTFHLPSSQLVTSSIDTSTLKQDDEPTHADNKTIIFAKYTLTIRKEDIINQTSKTSSSLDANMSTWELDEDAILTNNTTTPCATDRSTIMQDNESTLTNSTTVLPSNSWGQQTFTISEGVVVAIVIGCAVLFIAVLTVLTFVANRLKHQKSSKKVQKRASSPEFSLMQPRSAIHNNAGPNHEDPMCITAGEMKIEQTSHFFTEYCSLNHVATETSYAKLNLKEPMRFNVKKTAIVPASGFKSEYCFPDRLSTAHDYAVLNTE